MAFIDDIHDDSNAQFSSGFPRDFVLTNELKTLFQHTLGDGRQKPWKRTHSQHWAPALAQASDKTVCCRVCGMTHIIQPNLQCPYCHENIGLYIELTCYLETNTDQIIWQYIREINSNKTNIPQRVFRAFSMQHHGQAEMEFYLSSNNEVILKPLNDDLPIYWASKNHQQGQFQRLLGELYITKEMIHNGAFLYVDQEATSRLIRLELKGQNA